MSITPDGEVPWYAKGGLVDGDYLASRRPHGEDYPIIPMEYHDKAPLILGFLELLKEKEESE